MTSTKAIRILNRTNLLFGSVGLVLCTQFFAPHAWKSFLAGWLVSVLNFELLKKMGSLLIPFYKGQTKNLRRVFYVWLFLKFLFIALIIALIAQNRLLEGLQVFPFLFGTMTILAASIVLAARELIEYAA